MNHLPSYKLVQRFMHEAGFDVPDPEKEAVFPSSKFMKLASRLIQYGAAQAEPEELTDEELRRRFLNWWNLEGSAMRPYPIHNHEEHARRISEIAWANGAYVARWGRPAVEQVAASTNHP